MSKQCLSLLQQLGLFSKKEKVVDLSLFDEKTISTMMQYYCHQRFRNLDFELSEIKVKDKFCGFMSSQSTSINLSTITSSLLIYNHLVIDDFLFREIVPESEQSISQKSAMGIPAKKTFDRKSIKKKLHILKDFIPFIESGFLTILPISKLHMPSEKIPFFYSEDNFRSDIPSNIHDFIHKKAIINPIKVHEKSGNLMVSTQPACKPCNAINVSFSDDNNPLEGMIYFYTELEELATDHDGGRYVGIKWSPNLQLEKKIFDVWVYQSINRAIIKKLKRLVSENMIARTINHSYITESYFEAELMAQSGFNSESSLSNALNFLEANDTLIKLESPKLALSFREKHSSAFERFRISLLEIADKLVGIPPDKFQDKAERLYITEILPQIDEIQKKLKDISLSGAKGTFVSLGSVALAVATGSSIPLIPGLLYSLHGALSETLPAISDYLHMKKRPEFIWMKLKK